MNLWEEQTERQPIRVAKVALGQQICKTNTQFRTFCRRNGKKVLRWHRRRLPIGGNIVLGILFWHLVWGSTPIRFMFMMSPHFPPGARKLFLAVVYSGLSLTLVCVCLYQMKRAKGRKILPSGFITFLMNHWWKRIGLFWVLSSGVGVC